MNDKGRARKKNADETANCCVRESFAGASINGDF
jgi:hypothetical protein